MRKKSATKKEERDGVTSYDEGDWEQFESVERAPYKIVGKYLFFSESRDLLVQLAHEELQNGGFHRAKTHMIGIVPPSGEYVLCLYYKDDSRKHELAAKYKGRPDLKYRYWKSDEDTRQGRYSKEFLENLSPVMRARFERKQGK